MRDFTAGSITKPLLLFSLPMLIGNIFQQAYSLVDMMIVGRFIGGQSLAAVGVSMYVCMFVLSILIGLTTGASVVISQFFGAKQYERLTRTVSVSILTLFGVYVFLAALGLIFSPFILRLLNVSEDIFGEALIYMRIILAGSVFPVFYNMYTAYMRALGDSRHPLYFLICSSLLNIALDLLFVMVLGMGVAGAAAATIISQSVSLFLCIAYTYRSMPLLQVKKLVFDIELFRLILKYGTPAAIQMSVVSLAQLTITRLINSFGALAMAGIAAANRIDQFATMPISTLSMAMSTFVAQNMGAGFEERAKKGFRVILIYMLCCSLFLSAILIIFSNHLISMFVSPSDVNAPEIIRIGSSYINIMVMFYFLFSFLFAFNGFFRGAGDAKIAMLFPILSLLIRVVSANCLVAFAGMGPEALAWSIPIGWGLCSLASWVYYRKRLWAGKTAVRAN